MGSILSYPYSLYYPTDIGIENLEDGINSFEHFNLTNDNTYLNIYKSSLDSIGTEAGHHALILDVAHETTNEQNPKGLMIHLVVPDKDNSQKVSCLVHRYKKESNLLLRSIKLGISTLPNEFNGHPVESLVDLKGWVIDSFEHDFIRGQCNGNKEWSSETNCHKYSAFLINQFGLEWPEGVENINDYPPWAIDLVAFYRNAVISYE